MQLTFWARFLQALGLVSSLCHIFLLLWVRPSSPWKFEGANLQFRIWHLHTYRIAPKDSSGHDHLPIQIAQTLGIAYLQPLGSLSPSLCSSTLVLLAMTKLKDVPGQRSSRPQTIYIQCQDSLGTRPRFKQVLSSQAFREVEVEVSRNGRRKIQNGELFVLLLLPSRQGKPRGHVGESLRAFSLQREVTFCDLALELNSRLKVANNHYRTVNRVQRGLTDLMACTYMQ